MGLKVTPHFVCVLPVDDVVAMVARVLLAVREGGLARVSGERILYGRVLWHFVSFRCSLLTSLIMPSDGLF